MEECQININSDYIYELQKKFGIVNFKRIEQFEGMYVTNPVNRSMDNDSKIFVETQAKRALRNFLPSTSEIIKNKLSYFSQEEDEDKIYKFNGVKDLQSKEKYAVQNIGHATQLIHIPGFNILTDPVLGNLNSMLYPEKTKSYPDIENLPKIDVVIISHNHRDHVDKSSLQKLLDHYNAQCWLQPDMFVPMGDKKLFSSFGFKKIEEVAWYTKISISRNVNGVKKNVNFISIPADHRSGRSGFDHHKSLVTSWVINPEQENVIFKYSGDTRALSDENQQAVDAVIWNEIQSKRTNVGKSLEIPNIICFEPSGPNYTRCTMDVTHQSTSYSALLKFVEAENLAKVSGKRSDEFLLKIQTIMMHHNKFELGPDRFNEGLFVLNKLLKYLDLNEEDLHRELARQSEKIEKNLDKEMLKKNMPFTSRPIIATLPRPTSLLVHAKDYIIKEIIDVVGKLKDINKEQVIEYVVKNTIFLKIGERLNDEEIVNSKFDAEIVQKYKGTKNT